MWARQFCRARCDLTRQAAAVVHQSSLAAQILMNHSAVTLSNTVVPTLCYTMLGSQVPWAILETNLPLFHSPTLSPCFQAPCTRHRTTPPVSQLDHTVFPRSQYGSKLMLVHSSKVILQGTQWMSRFTDLEQLRIIWFVNKFTVNIKFTNKLHWWPLFKCLMGGKIKFVGPLNFFWLLFSLHSYPTLPMNPLPPNSLPKLSYDSPRYKLTPERAIALIKWFEEHKDHPYPTRHEKILLCQSTQLTFTQVGRRIACLAQKEQGKWGWWGWWGWWGGWVVWEMSGVGSEDGEGGE